MLRREKIRIIRQAGQVFVALLFVFAFQLAKSQDVLFSDNFDNGDLGWILESTDLVSARSLTSSWVIDVPGGGFGYDEVNRTFIGNSDPDTDFTADNSINFVLGQGLKKSSKAPGKSAYNNNSIETATSPVFNCTGYSNITLSFARWANFEPNKDEAYIEISIDGNNWISLNQPYYPIDKSWIEVSVDITEYATDQDSVFLRWKSISDDEIFYSGWNIDNVVVTGELVTEVNWEGNSSTDWSDRNNWMPKVKPNINTNAIISNTTTNISEIITSAQVKMVTIQNSGVLNVFDTVSLHILTDLVFVENSDIPVLFEHSNVQVDGVVKWNKRILSSNWNVISSPISGSSISDPNYRVHSWNEVNAKDDWTFGWENAFGSELMLQKGYYVSASASADVVLQGSLNTTATSISLTNSAGLEIEEHKGWNLLGNPFSTYIDWEAFKTSGIYNALYSWDKEAAVYKVYIDGTEVNGGSRYIAPAQGFFVKMIAEGAMQLTIGEDAKVLKPSVNQKSGKNLGFISIKASNSYYTDETVVRFNSITKDGFDDKMDAIKKESPNGFVPQIYTSEGNSNYAINTFKPFNGYTSVSLTVSSEISDLTTLVFTGLDNLDTDVYLEDKVEKVLVKITGTNEYKFRTSKFDPEKRFALHFGNPLAPVITVENETCENDANGIISASFTNEDFFKTIRYNNKDVKEINGLTGGEYNITLIDIFKNEYSYSVNVEVDGEFAEEIAKEAEEGIYNTINLAGAASDYYEWNSEDIFAYASMMQEGVFEVVLENQYGCQITKSYSPASKSTLGIDVNNLEFSMFQSLEGLVVEMPEISNSTFTLYDMNGKVILQEGVSDLYNVFEVTFKSGIYIGVIKNGSQSNTQKISIR